MTTPRASRERRRIVTSFLVIVNMSAVAGVIAYGLHNRRIEAEQADRSARASSILLAKHQRESLMAEAVSGDSRRALLRVVETCDAETLRAGLYNAAYYGKESAFTDLIREHHRRGRLDDAELDRLLGYAAQTGSVEITQTLLCERERHDGMDLTGPLSFAIQRGYARVVRLLLAAGASVDRPVGRLDDEAGFTPLMQAAHCGQATVVRILLVAGADVNARSAVGQTALQIARLARKTPRQQPTGSNVYVVKHFGAPIRPPEWDQTIGVLERATAKQGSERRPALTHRIGVGPSPSP